MEEIKSIKLCELISSFEDDSSFAKKNGYNGTEAKLEAFDCFHRSLNCCVSGSVFNTVDAAFILKQLNPNLLRMLIPLITQNLIENQSDKETKNMATILTGMIDQHDSEVISINTNNDNIDTNKNDFKDQTSPNGVVLQPAQMSIKSNSCSPVSAAVQALISFSGPITDPSNTISTENKFKLFGKPSSEASTPVSSHIKQSKIKTTSISKVLVSSKVDPFICTTVSKDAKLIDQINNSQTNYNNQFDLVQHFNLLLNTPNLDTTSGLSCPLNQQFSPALLTSASQELDTVSNSQIYTQSDIQPVPVISNILTLDHQPFLEQQAYVPNDSDLIGLQLNSSTCNLFSRQNCINVGSSLSTNIATTANSSSKVDDKKMLVKYSIPPNHIFPIKINRDAGTLTKSSFIPLTSKKSIEPQGKEVVSFKEKMNPDLLIVPKLASKSLPLEVASALLSMGSESKDSETSLNIIKRSLQQQCFNSGVMFTESGNIKIDNVEIDPRKHKLQKDSFTCGKCGRVFTTVLYLSRHIKRVCPDMSQRKWKCDRCDKAFQHPFGLQQHLYTHTGERPHKCQLCEKAFYSSNDLRRHTRTHSGERPYKCKYCEKRFSTTVSLKIHTYIHTGERPHRCPYCVKTFATSSKLSRHIVTHAEKRPFPCEFCSKSFNRSGDFRKHNNRFHGKNNELLPCQHCNKLFATIKCLNAHQAKHKSDHPSQ